VYDKYTIKLTYHNRSLYRLTDCIDVKFSQFIRISGIFVSI